ncbi:MAG: hypothetical protein K0V04_42445 [Deltaproteobacteria bacterium]|nr:hypothetical protein [Deltaproteobacteria bacterium]
MSPRPDPRRLIRRLYRQEHGYDVSDADEARVSATRASSTYGELLPAATNKLATHLALGKRDTFYDLGSGLGKVVLQLAVSRPMAGCFGIELVRSRHRVAVGMLRRVQQLGLVRTRACGFRCSDFMRARIGDATVVYSCSTAFSTAFMNELAARLATLDHGLRWVTTQDVDDNPWFRLESIFRLDMSWRRRSKVHVYRLHQPR